MLKRKVGLASGSLEALCLIEFSLVGKGSCKDSKLGGEDTSVRIYTDDFRKLWRTAGWRAV